MGKKKRKRPFEWTPEKMREIMELRRSNASQKHRNKKVYKRRGKFNREISE